MADIERARALRKRETWAEKLMWRWLRDRHFAGYKFRRQRPEGIYYLSISFARKRASPSNWTGSATAIPNSKGTMTNARNS